MLFFVQLINGLQLGAIYALVALGYTMVYGIVKLINFAHGDLMMVGAYLSLLLYSSGLPLYFALPLAILTTSLTGVLIERVAYRPLRNASRLSALITAIGISLLLQNTFMILFSSTPRRFPSVSEQLPVFVIGTNRISFMAVLTVLFAVGLMILLTAFVHGTRMGKAMRAVSEDMRAAQLMGINVNRIISMTFAIGSALAAFAAILYGFSFQQIDPYMGAMPGIKAFIAAVLGGIGILPGAMLGGFLLGIIESLTKAVMPAGYTQLADAVVFLVLILVLLFKPSGLLGQTTREKV